MVDFENKENIRVGDLVYYKTGSILMTVTEIKPSGKVELVFVEKISAYIQQTTGSHIDALTKIKDINDRPWYK